MVTGMNDTTLGLLIASVAYTIILVGGFVTGTMWMPPAMSFRRDKNPNWYWIAAGTNILIAGCGWYAVFTV